MAFRISLFNHKGGVSKTTTSYNLGWQLALLGKRVLLVDGDPQCNLSGLILGDNFYAHYENESTKAHNIKDGVRPAFEARPVPIGAVDCVQATSNTNLFLLAGHADLSEYDAALSFAQNSNNAITTLQNLPGAFNKLIEATCEKYNIDFVFIDMNPGLSAINQNLFISSDAFIIPTNPDPFSLMALDTLSSTLPRWISWVNRMRPLFVDSVYPLPDTHPQFIGTIIQRFNIRNGKASAANQDFIANIKETIKDKFVPALRRADMMFDPYVYTDAGIPTDYCLEQIPDFQGLLPKAYDAGKAVFDLTDEDLKATGIVLEGMKSSQDRFKQIFSQLADMIIKVEEHATSVPAV